MKRYYTPCKKKEEGVPSTLLGFPAAFVSRTSVGRRLRRAISPPAARETASPGRARERYGYGPHRAYGPNVWFFPGLFADSPVESVAVGAHGETPSTRPHEIGCNCKGLCPPGAHESARRQVLQVGPTWQIPHITFPPFA